MSSNHPVLVAGDMRIQEWRIWPKLGQNGAPNRSNRTGNFLRLFFQQAYSLSRTVRIYEENLSLKKIIDLNNLVPFDWI